MKIELTNRLYDALNLVLPGGVKQFWHENCRSETCAHNSHPQGWYEMRYDISELFAAGKVEQIREYRYTTEFSIPVFDLVESASTAELAV